MTRNIDLRGHPGLKLGGYISIHDLGDLRGHPGLKLGGYISIHRYYKPTKFHQNQKGQGQKVPNIERFDVE